MSGDGSVYAPQGDIYRVLKFSPALADQAKSGAGAGQFEQPMGMDVDEDGNVLVGDTGRSMGYRTHKFSPDGTSLATIPRAVRNLLHTDNTVLVYNEDLHLKRTWRGLGASPASSTTPAPIAVGADASS